MKIRNLLWISTGATCLIIFVLLAVSYRSLNSTLIPTLEAGAEDATVINIAGRQRMLTQKMSKEALAVAAGVPGAAELLEATRSEYAANLNDLMRGNEGRGIAMPPTDVIAKEFQAVMTLWVPFNIAVDGVLAGGAERTAGLAFINDNNIALLKASNKAVVDWAAYSRGRTTSMLASSRAGLNLSVVVGLFAALLSLVLALLIVRRIMGPLNRAKSLVAAYAQGDLSGSIEVASDDEIGEITTAINDMGSQLRDIMAELVTRGGQLQSSSLSMASSAEQAHQNAGELNAQVVAAATSFSQLNGVIDGVTGNVDDADHAIQTIAAAIEEMATTVGQISEDSARERRVAESARDSASASQVAMRELVESTERIGGVVEIISDIADQTNLLALNARIEAARAGQAGSGFTVVANEVKELARKTMVSTQEIAQVMARIQVEAQTSGEAIKGVADSIYEVTEISESVSVAVGQQAAALHDINSNMVSANQKMRDVTAGIHGVHDESASINANLHAVERIAGDALAVANATRQGAEATNSVSSGLAEIVDRFEVSR